jgi:hypothetical protein
MFSVGSKRRTKIAVVYRGRRSSRPASTSSIILTVMHMCCPFTYIVLLPRCGRTDVVRLCGLFVIWNL